MIDNEYKRLQQLPSFATMEEVPPVHVDLLHVMRFFFSYFRFHFCG